MTALGGFGKPGAGAISRNTVAELLWGGDNAKGLALFQSAVISGTARDDGNTPTTVLRPGLILGIITSSGEYAEWDPDATDGTQNIAGVLAEELKVLSRLPQNRLDSCQQILVKVGPSSTIRVKHNVYSVFSRLIGESVNVRLYAEHLEINPPENKRFLPHPCGVHLAGTQGRAVV